MLANHTTLRVLVIDDNPDDRALLGRSLEQEFPGIALTEIGTPDRLKEELEKGEFDAVVTDYQLRWSNGMDVLNAVKARHSLVPVLLFTNSGNEEIAVEAMKAGVDDYIVKKAANFARLPLALRRALENAATRRLAAELEQRLQVLLNQLNVGVFRATLEGDLIDGNAAFLRLLRQDSLEQARQAFAGALLQPPAERQQSIDRMRSTGKPVEREIQLHDETGAPTWVSLSETLTRTVGDTVIDGMVEDITEYKQLNARLQRAMSETHHRVKNSLQMMGALVEMRVLRHEEAVPVEELHHLAQHVRALAAIHDLLTMQSKGDVEASTLPVRAAMERLLPVIQSMLEGRMVAYDFDEVLLPIRMGTALAVVINEVVSNAVKHGRGTIRLRLRVNDPMVRLEVEDEGPGFPKDFDVDTLSSSGVELIRHLVTWDLRGRISFLNGATGGALVVAEFPLPEIPS